MAARAAADATAVADLDAEGYAARVAAAQQPTPALLDQLAALAARIATLESNAATQPRDFRDAIRSEIDEYDFDDQISRAIEDHDFESELNDAVEDALSNYDFSEAIRSALDDHDLTRVIEETLRGKTITIR